MKNFRLFVAFVLCLGSAGLAKADQIDFAMNILDPSPPGGNFLFSNTFDVSFSPCSAFSSPSAPVSADGCYEGINSTGVLPNTTAQTWNSLTITIVDPNDILGINNASCGGAALPGPSIFSSATCTESGDTYTVTFSAGTIVSGQSFFIEENGVPNASFPESTALAGTTPEPSSLLLLSTGTLMFGGLLYTSRRRLQLCSARRP